MYLWMVVDLWMLSMYIYLGHLCISNIHLFGYLETLVLTSIVYDCIPVDDWKIHRHQVDEPYTSNLQRTSSSYYLCTSIWYLDLPRGAEWMIRGAYTPSPEGFKQLPSEDAGIRYTYLGMCEIFESIFDKKELEPANLCNCPVKKPLLSEKNTWLIPLYFVIWHHHYHYGRWIYKQLFQYTRLKLTVRTCQVPPCQKGNDRLPIANHPFAGASS